MQMFRDSLLGMGVTVGRCTPQHIVTLKRETQPFACESFRNFNASGRLANVTGSGVRSFARSVKAVAVHFCPARPAWNPMV
jgi:hypothetical protein